MSKMLDALQRLEKKTRQTPEAEDAAPRSSADQAASPTQADEQDRVDASKTDDTEKGESGASQRRTDAAEELEPNVPFDLAAAVSAADAAMGTDDVGPQPIHSGFTVENAFETPEESEATPESSTRIERPVRKPEARLKLAADTFTPAVAHEERLFRMRFHTLVRRYRHEALPVVDAVFEATEPLGPAVVALPRMGQSDGREILPAVAVELLARCGGEILLVDGDYRENALTRRLDYASWHAFGDVVLGAIPWSDPAAFSGIEGVTFLPGGPLPGADPVLPQWVDAEDLYARWRDRFQVTLITLPPPSDGVAARLAAQADLVFPWCESGCCGRRELAREMKRLRRRSACCVSLIMVFGR
ncbi:MAG: hypothetical protein D6741_16955 [Planctomycetota bacterium]|nr:MAG: hypothetical protein D6741_16955 [Planctomycetota bacterium]